MPNFASHSTKEDLLMGNRHSGTNVRPKEVQTVDWLMRRELGASAVFIRDNGIASRSAWDFLPAKIGIYVACSTTPETGRFSNYTS
jgi:hypothetical protein